MNRIINFLNGKKSYIGVIAGAVYSIAIYYGKVENNPMIWTAIATWTGVSFRLALANNK